MIGSVFLCVRVCVIPLSSLEERENCMLLPFRQRLLTQEGIQVKGCQGANPIVQADRKIHDVSHYNHKVWRFVKGKLMESEIVIHLLREHRIQNQCLDVLNTCSAKCINTTCSCCCSNKLHISSAAELPFKSDTAAVLSNADNEQNPILSSHTSWTYSKQVFEFPCFGLIYVSCVFVLGNWMEYFFF